MAKPKRNPDIVGKHWLAWHALHGEEDVSFVREYVSHARDLIGDLSADLRPADSRDTKEELVGLHLFLIGLEQGLAEEGTSEFKVTIGRRKPGKPINRTDRANAGHKAAAMVEKAVEAGTKQEAAIADAVQRTGLSRSEIFKWLANRRRTRDWHRERQAKIEEDRKRDGLPPLAQSG